jgi:methionyl-tRNA synthetase
MTKNNSELLNNLGNFINRSLSFLEKFFESTVPPMNLKEEDYHIVARVNQEISTYVALQDVCKMKDALRQILSISKIGNQYFQAQKPWTLTKKPEDLPRCSTICGLGAQIVFVLATLLEPYMPETSATILQQLNVPKILFSTHLQQFIPPGHKIGKVKPLFQKMEPAVVESFKQRFGGPQQKS